MTESDVWKLLDKLATFYPSLNVAGERKRRVVDAWLWVLADADEEAVMAAARRWVRDRQSYPPRPGDILAMAGETRALIDPVLHGRYATLRRQLQLVGSLPDHLCREMESIERQIGLRPGSTVASWQQDGDPGDHGDPA